VKGRPEIEALVNKYRTAVPESNSLTRDLDSIARQKDIDSTEKQRLTMARIGQGSFRQNVLRLWGNGCAVTGSTTIAAIRASHIKPWCDSTNEERLDPYNGLALVASLDALFDAGLISFDADGEMVVSTNLIDSERGIFGLVRQSLKSEPPKETAEYLQYHRKMHGFAD
jgi:putative restriction endonuclease